MKTHQTPRGPQHDLGRHRPMPSPLDERPIRAPRISDQVQYTSVLHFGHVSPQQTRAAIVTAVYADDVVDLYVFPQFGEPAHAHGVRRAAEPTLARWHWPIDTPGEPHAEWPQ